MPKNDDLQPQYQSDDQPQNGGAVDNSLLPSEITERMFLVVRSLKQDDKKLDYKLRKNDIVKLGRVKFKVKEIHIKAVEDQKARLRHRKEKCLKRMQEERKAEVPPPMVKVDGHQMAPLPMQSSEIGEALDGEESFIEVECVLPQDQLRNQKQWMSHRQKERKKEATKKGIMTERVDGAGLKQGDDATHVDLPARLMMHPGNPSCQN